MFSFFCNVCGPADCSGGIGTGGTPGRSGWGSRRGADMRISVSYMMDHLLCGTFFAIDTLNREGADREEPRCLAKGK